MAVLTLGHGADGRGALFTVQGRPPVAGVLDDVVDTTARVRALLRPPVGLLLPGDDARRATVEREAGALLAGLLGASPEVGRALARWQGAHDAHADPPWLAIDARTTAWADLPWELLEVAPHGAPGGGCRVCRLVPGAGRAARTDGPVQVEAWSPTPDDSVVTGVRERLQGLVSTLPSLRWSDGDAPPAGARRVLHLIAHGRRELDTAVLEATDGVQGATTARSTLAPRLAHADLVVVDVCHAGTAADGDGPARVLAEAGVPVLAPATALDAEAASHLHAGLYEALVGGASWMAAIAEGRRRVQAAGLAHDAGRWWNVVVWVSRAPEPPVTASAGASEAEAPVTKPRRGPAALGLVLLALVGVTGAVAYVRAATQPVALSVDEDTVLLLPLSPTADPTLDDPAHGTLSSSADGWTYVPESDWHGVQTIRARDGLLPWQAVIRVDPVPDRPRLVLTDTDTIAGEPVPLSIAATDPDGDDLTWSVDAPALGQVVQADAADPATWSYVPDPGKAGTDVVVVHVSDGTATVDGSLRVTIAPPPARPVMPRFAAPAGQGLLEVRPVGRVTVTVDGAAWGAATKVMPARQRVASGTHRVVAEGTEGAVTCTVDVPIDGQARVCPDPVSGGCACP